MSTTEELVLGRYRVLRPLAHGGHGIVFLGRSEGADGFAKPVIIKRVLPHLGHDPKYERRFAREARIQAELSHPHIVDILDFGRDAQGPVMILEYVRGFDFGRFLAYRAHLGRPPRWPLAIDIALAVLDALAYAHALRSEDGALREIVHGDVHPSNVLLGVDGSVKLLDFGMARMRADAIPHTTQVGAVRGNFPYLAPELFDGARPSTATDVYSCVAMLDEALRGENPFRGRALHETVQRVARHVPPRLDGVRPEIPPPLAVLIERELAKDRAARIGDALAVSDALKACVREPLDRVRAERVALVAGDFAAPDFAAITHAVPIQERERAWREGGPKPSDAPAQGAATVTLTRSGETSLDAGSDTPIDDVAFGQYAPRSRLAPRAAYAVGAGGLLAAAVALGALMARPEERPAAPPAVVLVRPREAAAAPAQNQPSAPPSRAAALSAAFESRGDDVEQCFRDHPFAGPENELMVRFEIDATGHVRRATTSPRRLASTPAGSCVLGVAREIEFGPQPAATAFAIPVRVLHGE